MYGADDPGAAQPPGRSAAERALPIPGRPDVAIIAENLTPGRSWSDIGATFFLPKRNGAVIHGASVARLSCL